MRIAGLQSQHSLGVGYALFEVTTHHETQMSRGVAPDGKDLTLQKDNVREFELWKLGSFVPAAN